MKLENLQPAKGAVRNNNRLGRGQGSGGGGTATRGHKGAKSRSGYSSKRGFEGGQMPLQRRVPKFGFNNINRIEYKAINLDSLQELFDGTGESNITLSFLRDHGKIGRTDLIKVLGRGELTAKISVEANGFSQKAIEVIQSLGGTTTTIHKGGTSTEKVSPVVVKVKKVKVTKTDDVKVESAKTDEVKVEAVKVVEEVAKTEVVVETAKEVKAKAVKADDLKKIEGIGPKIAELLVEAGIDTFSKLASTEVSVIEGILSEAGGNFASHNPTTWPEQSALAAAGSWDELKELQDKLNGGRPE